MALTCLGEFAQHIDIKHTLTVNVTAFDHENFIKMFYITNENYAVTQTTEVRIIWVDHLTSHNKVSVLRGANKRYLNSRNDWRWSGSNSGII